MLQLRDDQLERLDADAVRAGVSRSKLVRDAVDVLLDGRTDRDVAEQYRDAYPTSEFGTDDWGDIDAWHEAAANQRATAARDSW